VGAAAYVLCSSPTLHDTSYSAQKSKPQYSSVTGAHASEATRRIRAPVRTNMLARAMGITCVEDLPDRDHTVWEVKELATAKLPTWLSLLYAPRNCQTRPHCDSLTTADQEVVGMLCCGVRLYLVVTGHEDAQGVANCGASCSLERWFHLMRRDKNPTASQGTYHYIPEDSRIGRAHPPASRKGTHTPHLSSPGARAHTASTKREPPTHGSFRNRC